MSILLYVEYDKENQALTESSEKALTAALKLQTCVTNSSIDLVLCSTELPQLGKLPIAKLFYAQNPIFTAQLPQNILPIILPLAKNYDYILAPDSINGKAITPFIAMHFDCAQISDIIEILDGATFKRVIYTGSAVATVRSNDAKKIITIRTTSFAKTAVCADWPDYTVEKLNIVEQDKPVKLLKQQYNNQETQSLEKAKIVVSGGRALESKEKFEQQLKPLAQKLSAAIGASRAAVDAGFAPNDWQVGQTGKIVSPQLYIAIGISGALQHLAGIKNSQIIVAINKDAQAPIIKIADYAIIGDLFEIVPQLTKALE